MSIQLKINGQPVAVNLSNLMPDITLNTFLRENRGLTGTKFMCQEGGCGVCVCVVKGEDPITHKEHIRTVNSCLTLLNTCDGLEVTTIEGLGTRLTGFNIIQKRLAQMNGTQCGYCSPGFIMNMHGLLKTKNNQVTMAEVENAFGGNICRCTGYRPILDTMKSFAVDSNIKVPSDLLDIEDLDRVKCPKTGEYCLQSHFTKSDIQQPLTYNDGIIWHWAKDLSDLYETLKKVQGKEYMLVCGNTGHGVYRRSPTLKHYIDITRIAVLHEYELTDKALVLGASTSLSKAMEIFLTAAEKPGFEYCKQLWDHFDLIANIPVRDNGTLAGNLMLKNKHVEFPSDVFVTFEAIGAQIVISAEPGHEETLNLEDFLQVDMDGKVILRFILPSHPKDRFLFDSFKIMPRAQNAHAYVNAAFLVEFDSSTKAVVSSRLCFGGINRRFNHAQNTEKFISRKFIFDKAILPQVIENLRKEIEPEPVLGESDTTYRKKLACGLFYKFILKNAPEVKPEFKTGGEKLKRELSSGVQKYSEPKDSLPVHSPLPKLEANIQCSGDAVYMNDHPYLQGQVWGALVTATKVGVKIAAIDASGALSMHGVLAFYSAADLPAGNAIVYKEFGFEDEEELFCNSTVKYYGQPIGVIVATSNSLAYQAVQYVKVSYIGVERPILPTLADVLRSRDSDRIKQVVKSPIEKIERPLGTDLTVSGELDIGLQYHFTMEPQTTVVVPVDQSLEVYSATQWMDLTQHVIAKTCGLKDKDAQLKVRRLGGAYGSKITRGNFIAAAAALACVKLGRPVRMVQTIESMMGSLGKRWACHNEYEFHVKADGKILMARNTFYEDAGWSENESPVALHSTLCLKNCYDFGDNYKIDGHAALTDAPSNTWCRAPGSVEGIAMIENIMEHIAFETKLDPMDLRVANITKGHKMHELLARFNQTTEYRRRRTEINAYNKANRWRKRGLGICFMEYPIFYFGSYPATVTVYHGDGSVVITHGGIEMGQGINTKVAQVAAFSLGIPVSMISVLASETVTSANSMVTGGAVGSESLCFAVHKCCNTLKERLQPIRNELGPKAQWSEVIAKAHEKMVHLVVNEQYKAGEMQPYNICGLSLTEIELDVLTGNHIIKRVDILEDTGESLNPLIDVGQIEGAFVMGLGYWLTEKLIYDRTTGELITNRTWNYKPPGAKDIPVDFRIELLQNSPNPAGFMRSKATGEPAVCLAISSVFAVQHAVQSARDDAGLPRAWVRFGAPTTPETIVLNSGTETEQFSLA